MVKKNIKLMQGNEACVQGAIAAGMRFYAGYPITPSTEIAEKSSELLPTVGGKFIQMEDEIAGIAAAIGGSLAGLKSMTATSGPGFSLKQENLGYATIAEIPLVIVNVQRGGPSTGLPTAPAQGEVMQAKWGTHGDHPVIALTPSSVRETYDLTVKAFNLAEEYSTPVILLLDEVVAHMREKIEVPNASEIQVLNRRNREFIKGEYSPYTVPAGEKAPVLAPFGSGMNYHVTGLIHDQSGFPTNSGMVAEDQITRICDKVEKNADEIIEVENYKTEDADFVLIAYGGTARSAKSAVELARKEGYKVGLLRPITIWPLASKQIETVAKSAKCLLTVEMNLGQYSQEVERVAKGLTKTYHYGRVHGELITPDEIFSKIKEVY